MKFPNHLLNFAVGTVIVALFVFGITSPDNFSNPVLNELALKVLEVVSTFLGIWLIAWMALTEIND